MCRISDSYVRAVIGKEHTMHRTLNRFGKVAAALMLGALFQAVAPIGCAGLLQQNLEVLYRFNSIANMPEMWQSFIWKVFGGPG